ncbi:MAG: hypothetical protein ABFD69_04765 [Candidatus Sumerlaeia bacterium]
MDTFDVEKLMRYDVLKEEWDANAGREHKPPGEKKPDADHGDETVRPAPTPATIAHHPSSIDSLRRGQKLEFVHGGHNWHAVYWGKDDQGHIIAHHTFKDWAFTRLDLHQYIDKIVVESEPDLELVQIIEQSLRNSKGNAQAA